MGYAGVLSITPRLCTAVAGHRQFLLSLRFGTAVDRPALLALLTGEEQAAAAPAADGQSAVPAASAADASA
jgi:hypothetical protein